MSKTPGGEVIVSVLIGIAVAAVVWIASYTASSKHAHTTKPEIVTAAKEASDSGLAVKSSIDSPDALGSSAQANETSRDSSDAARLYGANDTSSQRAPVLQMSAEPARTPR